MIRPLAWSIGVLQHPDRLVDTESMLGSNALAVLLPLLVLAGAARHSHYTSHQLAASSGIPHVVPVQDLSWK